MNWMRQEWSMQWPRVRFEIYKSGAILVGGSVIALAAKLLHGVFRIPDSYFYGALFVIACTCFVLLLNRLSHAGTGKRAASSDDVERENKKLVIHRAVYAAGLDTEVSVTDKLQNATRDALVVTVDSTLGGLLPTDPASGVPKRLDVTYSYGSDKTFDVSRLEAPPGQIMRLVIPEDSKAKAQKVEEITKDQDLERLQKIAKEDLENIRERVMVTKQKTIFHFDIGSDPYIEVVLSLWNASVFDIMTFGKVQGHTMYGQIQLPIPVNLFDSTGPPGPTYLSLRHCGPAGVLRLRQFVSHEVADRMYAERDRKIPIDFELVAIEFTTCPVVKRFDIYGPMVTISEAERV